LVAAVLMNMEVATGDLQLLRRAVCAQTPPR
jgi:hypothetical protein